MEPLSILSSVAGLLMAAGSVSRKLTSITSSLKDAPYSVHEIQFEVGNLSASLSAIQGLLLGQATAPRQRIALIQLDQLVATLTEAVLIVSELEALVIPFTATSAFKMIERVKWAWKEDAVAPILQRLQRHKSSLLLMLNIVLCGSDIEAQQSRDKLQILVEQLLESNQDMSQRLRRLEESCESQSILTKCFGNRSTDAMGRDDENGDIVTITPNGFFDFENELERSRVYNRTQKYESDISFTSSVVRTQAWSIFSGLSLSEVSNISAIGLPLSCHEISNRHWYELGDSAQPDWPHAATVSDGSLTLSTGRRRTDGSFN